jgi:PAS domain S-box-containing protein
MRTAEGSGGLRAAVGAVIAARASEIVEEWFAALQPEWGDHAEVKLEMLREDRKRRKDPLAVLEAALLSERPPAGRLGDPFLARVRAKRYSIVDLYVEISCLEQAVRTALRRESLGRAELEEGMGVVRGELGRMLKSVLQDTSEIYEQVLESGMRAFCYVDTAGRIIFANERFKELASCEQVVGRSLGSFFLGEERQVVRNATQAPKPLQRLLTLVACEGGHVIVGAEVGSLVIAGQNRGGYASFVNLVQPMQLYARIFDQSPLGIVKLSLDGEFTYANQSMLGMLGLDSLAGKNLKDVCDAASYAQAQAKLRERREGKGGEYELEIRPREGGCRVPVRVAAMPETDLDGNIIGSIAVIRNVSVEKVSAAIHGYICNVREAQGILAGVAQELERFMPFERFSVSVYSPDLGYVRRFFSCERGARPASLIEASRRWLALSAAQQVWLRSLFEAAQGDFEERLAEPRWQGLRDLPEIQALLRRGLRFYASIPVVREGRLVASATLFSTKPYEPGQIDRLARLPLSEAVLMGLYYEEREELVFRFSLLKRISLASNNVKEMAHTLVEALADHYQWSNVALFLVDAPGGVFRLLAQRGRPGNPAFQPGLALPASQGVLGWVYREQTGVRIGDVLNDEKFSRIYAPLLPATRSELCLPVTARGQVIWLLNVEDARQEAFAPEEEAGLRLILGELTCLLDRSRRHFLHQAVCESASDAVIAVDVNGSIVEANVSAHTMLGRQPPELLGTRFASYLEGGPGTEGILHALGTRTDEVWLAPAKDKRRNVLLSVAPLPDEIGGRVFVAKDLLPYKQARRLELLEQVYADVATQMKTPLSLVLGWLQRLECRGGDRETRDTLRKAQRQLKQIELTYDRLALATWSSPPMPSHAVLLDLPEIFDRIRQDFPESELEDNVEMITEPGLLPVRADLFQLSFCVCSILSYLLRFVAPNGRVRLGLCRRDDQVCISIAGVIPEMPVGISAAGVDRAALAKLLAEVALGEQVIQRFVKGQGGKFSRETLNSDRVRFEIVLPAAQTPN